MTAGIALAHEKCGVQIRLFLTCLYCQEQLENKIFLKNGVILVLKYVLKEHCT